MRKNPYPPIFDICKCGCNEIVWNGKEFIHGHNSQNRKLSKETIKRMSENNKGERNPNYGKKISEEVRQKMSESHKKIFHNGMFKKGKSPWNKGLTKEIDDRINKIAKKRKGIIFSEEHIKNLSCSHKNQKPSEKHKKILSDRWKEENNPAWQGGISYFPYCPKFNRRKREEIRNEFNRRCYICNKDEKDNITKTNKKIRKLCIHHVDLDKGQGCNGKKWKLIPLCGSCHSKLHRNKFNIILKEINNNGFFSIR